MFLQKAVILAMATMSSTFMAAQGQSDYLDPLVPPATVYESTVIGPQNMDFDATNNMFVAHSGWYQDRLVHYYKFRMYTPSTYPGMIAPGSTSADVPLQNIYFMTTTGDFDGVVGKPVIEFHTQDGLDYSDFMVVNFVEVSQDYTEDALRSVGDVMASNFTMTATEIVLNIPVVPTGSTLQHPIEKGDAIAPIQPVPVLYGGVEVWTYVFEVSDESAATFFAYTRSPAISPQRLKNTLVTGFEIPILPFYATSEVVSAIPIWHVNQFSRGVTESNGGGPNPMGMRNVIDMDRPDAGYSPLWQVFWATEMPINYMADEFSNANVATTDNGFAFFTSPMFVNCPDIGLVGEEMNPLKKEAFMMKIDLETADSFYIIGSHPSLIMQGGMELSFVSDDGTDLGTTETNMMGGYEFELMKSSIPEGAIKVKVMKGDEVLRTIKIGTKMDMDMDDTEDTMEDTTDTMEDGMEDSMESAASSMSRFTAALGFLLVGAAMWL